MRTLEDVFAAAFCLSMMAWWTSWKLPFASPAAGIPVAALWLTGLIAAVMVAWRNRNG